MLKICFNAITSLMILTFNALLLFRVLIRGRVWKPPVDVCFIGDCSWFLRPCVGQFASQEDCVNPSGSKHLPLRVGDSKISLTNGGTKAKTELLFCTKRKIAIRKQKRNKKPQKRMQTIWLLRLAPLLFLVVSFFLSVMIFSSQLP